MWSASLEILFSPRNPKQPPPPLQRGTFALHKQLAEAALAVYAGRRTSRKIIARFFFLNIISSLYAHDLFHQSAICLQTTWPLILHVEVLLESANYRPCCESTSRIRILSQYCGMRDELILGKKAVFYTIALTAVNNTRVYLDRPVFCFVLAF